MSQQDILDQLYALIAPFNKKTVALSPKTTFASDLEFDSLTVMDLVAEIEDEFDIILPLSMLPELESIEDLAAAVARIQEKAG